MKLVPLLIGTLILVCAAMVIVIWSAIEHLIIPYEKENSTEKEQ